MFQFAQPLKMMEFTAFVEKQGAGENADSVSFSSVVTELELVPMYTCEYVHACVFMFRYIYIRAYVRTYVRMCLRYRL